MSEVMPAKAADRAARAPGRVVTFAVRNGVYLFLVVLIIASGLVSPSFFYLENLGNLLSQFSPLGIVVIGQTFVILVGGLDLSVASIMATAAVAATSFPGRIPTRRGYWRRVSGSGSRLGWSTDC